MHTHTYTYIHHVCIYGELRGPYLLEASVLFLQFKNTLIVRTQTLVSSGVLFEQR